MKRKAHRAGRGDQRPVRPRNPITEHGGAVSEGQAFAPPADAAPESEAADASSAARASAASAPADAAEAGATATAPVTEVTAGATATAKEVAAEASDASPAPEVAAEASDAATVAETGAAAASESETQSEAEPEREAQSAPENDAQSAPEVAPAASAGVEAGAPYRRIPAPEDAAEAPSHAAPAPEAWPAVKLENDKRASLVFEIVDWAKYILLALIVGLFLTSYVIQRNEVLGASMLPTLQSGDRVWVEKVSKLWGGLGRGDVVTVHGSALGGEQGIRDDLVKRIIALPGDRIRIADGAVYLNGAALEEPYLAQGIETYMPGGEDYEATLGEREYFVMGDNRPASRDSRFFGPVDRDSIMGEVWFRSSPWERIGLVR